METLINNFVSEHLATFVFACLVALAIFAIALWFVYSYIQFKKTVKCNEHSQKLEELGKIGYDLPCKTHGEKIEKHGESVSRIDTTLSFLTKSIEEMNSQLRQMNNTVPFTQQHSPLRISERGWQVVEKLGMDKMFDRNWERIRKLIDEEVESKNAYDINEFCIKYAVVFPEKFLQPDEVDVLKNDAYIQGLTLMEYMKIIAVMARDKYFEENNIKTDEVEKGTKSLSN